LFPGKLKPATAFMSGKLKLQGDMGKAMKLEKIMGKMNSRSFHSGRMFMPNHQRGNTTGVSKLWLFYYYLFSCVWIKVSTCKVLGLWLDCVHFSKIFFSRNFSKKIIFSKNSREKKSKIEFFFILLVFWLLKWLLKLASIEINDEILSKVGGIRKFFGKNFLKCEKWSQN
jgi:hypothetical protein